VAAIGGKVRLVRLLLRRPAEAAMTTRPRPIAVVFVAACPTWLAACGGTGSTQAHVASASCTLKTPAAWQQFLDTTTNDETWVKTCGDNGDCSALDGWRTAHVDEAVVNVLDACTEDLAQNPIIAACTANLRRYVPAWLDQHGRSYGFRQDNRTYFAAQTAPDMPSGMMDPPSELVAALQGRSSIEEAARTNGWPYLTHDSALGGIRTFVDVVDPQQRFEQWINVGYSIEGGGIGETVSFIAVQKKDAAGQDLSKVRIHFRDYRLVRDPSANKLELPETFDAKCYGCHVSGLRPFLALRGSVAASAPVKGEDGFGQMVADDFGMKRLASLNQRFLSYGVPDWNGALEPFDHGPALGRSLGCTQCHDGATRGAVTVSASTDTLSQKVVWQLSMRSPRDGKRVPDEAAMALLDRYNGGSLPPSESERAALDQARAEHEADYETLMASRFPDWRAWVLGSPCATE
jgi:hypothetical protein